MSDARNPYRTTPPAPTVCEQCGAPIAGPAARETRSGPRLCRGCFLGRYDAFSVVGLIAITVGAARGSNMLLLSGIGITLVGAWVIHRGG